MRRPVLLAAALLASPVVGCVGNWYGSVDASRCLVPGGPPFLEAQLTSPGAPGDLGWMVRVDDEGALTFLEAERSHQPGTGAIDAGEHEIQNVTVTEIRDMLQSFDAYNRSFDYTVDLAFQVQPSEDALRELCGVVLDRFLGVEDWRGAHVDDGSWWNVSVSTAEGGHQAVYENHGGPEDWRVTVDALEALVEAERERFGG